MVGSPKSRLMYLVTRTSSVFLSVLPWIKAGHSLTAELIDRCLYKVCINGIPSTHVYIIWLMTPFGRISSSPIPGSNGWYEVKVPGSSQTTAKLSERSQVLLLVMSKELNWHMRAVVISWSYVGGRLLKKSIQNYISTKIETTNKPQRFHALIKALISDC